MRQIASKAFLSRHATKCRICQHPNRAAIEFEFIHWRNPATLAKAYHLRDLSTVYRHAHALNLFPSRRLNIRGLMERIAERVDEVPVTAAAVIRAARAISRINDAGEWIDPPTRLIISHADAPEPSPQSVEIKKSPRAIFQPAQLEEPLPSPECADLPPIGAKSQPAVPPEIILEISPALYAARQERKRALEADRLALESAKAASGGTGSSPPVQDNHFSEAAPPDAGLTPPPPLPGFSRVRLAPWSQATLDSNPAVAEAASRSGGFIPPVFGTSGEGSAVAHVTAPCPELARRGEPSRTGQPVQEGSSALPQATFNPAVTASPEQPRGSADSKACLGGRGFSPDIKDRPSDTSLLPQAASRSGGFIPPAFGTSGEGGAVAHGTAPCPDPSRTGQPAQEGSSALPQAAVPNSAPSALPPQVSPPSAQDPLRRIGSSGTTDPPFPFDFTLPRNRRHWRHR